MIRNDGVDVMHYSDQLKQGFLVYKYWLYRKSGIELQELHIYIVYFQHTETEASERVENSKMQC